MRKFIFSFIILLSFTACDTKETIDLNQFKNVSFINDGLQVEAEYGCDLDLEEIMFQLGKEGLDFVAFDVPTDTVGTQNIDVLVDELKAYDIKIDVVDTTPPKFSGETEFTIYKDETIDFKKYVKAKDPVDGKVKVEFGKYDTSKIGKQTLTAKATDKHGNEETIELTLNIKEKPVETEAFANANTNSNSQSTPTSQSNSANQSSTTQSKPTSQPTSSSSGSAHRNMAIEMFNIVNQTRANNGVHKLVWSEELHRGANIRANEISKSFSHTRPNGSSFSTVSHLAYGENLAFGYHNAQSAHQGLMNSPGHRANILDTDFKTMGIGVYLENGTYYYAQLFGY